MDTTLQKMTTLGLTSDQNKAYNELIGFIKAPYNDKDYKRSLSGPAGTGKTYLIKTILLNSGYSFSRIGVAAPTHKACRVLQEAIGSTFKVNTLQSDLGLKLNFNVENFNIKNPPFDLNGRIKVENYKIYVVDESSMINTDLCKFLEDLCKQYKCKLIYIGDAFQLAPVNNRYSSAFKGVKGVSLQQIVRQEENNPCRKLLSILRNDIINKTPYFLQYIIKNKEQFDEGMTKGYRVCNTSEFKSLVNINFNDPQLIKDVDFVKIVGYTNRCVSAWNKYVRTNIIKNANTSILTKNDLIISYTTIINNFNDIIISNSEDYILQDIVNYTNTEYNLKGFLVKFTAIHGGKTTTPLFILDHTDRYTITKYVQITQELINIAKSTPVKLRPQKWREYYAFKEQKLILTDIVDANDNVLIKRDLDYGFALTAHKSQGSTFGTTFVDVDDIVFDKYGKPYTNIEETNRRLYVACSRAKHKLYLKFNGR